MGSLEEPRSARGLAVKEELEKALLSCVYELLCSPELHVSGPECKQYTQT